MWRAVFGAYLGVLLALASAIVALPGHVQAAAPMTVRFIDVGAGDATWVTTPDQHTLLIDCGPLSYGKQLAEDLRSAKVSTVDMMVLSNAHPEAVGGCVEILRRLTVGTVLVPAQVANSPAWQLFLSQLANTNIRVANAVAGADPDPIGNVALHVLNPVDSGQSGGVLDEFDDSTVLVVDYLGTRVLVAGDIHARGEAQADAGLRQYAPFAIVRVPDHASASSTSQGFLNDVQAQNAVISYALDSAAPAPDPNTLKRLTTSVPRVFTTAHDGTVVATIDELGNVSFVPQSPAPLGV
jgi:beta-lactamase superfamily II metal-dependent hydrolase